MLTTYQSYCFYKVTNDVEYKNHSKMINAYKQIRLMCLSIYNINLHCVALKWTTK